MEINSSVKMKPVFKTKYPFDEMSVGDSIHFRVEVLRKRALIAFNSWAKRTGNTHLKPVSRKVDDSDPKGAGWRLWMSSVAELKAMQEASDAEFRKNWGSAGEI